VDQIILYLQYGCVLWKIPNKPHLPAKKRFFFFSDDLRKILSCEVDETSGGTAPLSRKKPTSTMLIRDIARILLGQCTSTFRGYGGGLMSHQLRDKQDGPSGPVTSVVTGENVGMFFYRSFSIEFADGRTVDVVALTDADAEAWAAGLHRLLGHRLGSNASSSMSGERSVQYGVQLPLSEIRSRPHGDKMKEDDITFCQRFHVTPFQFATAASLCQRRDESVSVLDLRANAGIDLIRAQALYEYLVPNAMSFQ